MKGNIKDDELPVHKWSMLTNHAIVLYYLALDPYLRLAELSDKVGITERAIQNILRDLESIGAIERIKEGRRNHYIVDLNHEVPLSGRSGARISDLFAAILPAQKSFAIGGKS